MRKAVLNLDKPKRLSSGYRYGGQMLDGSFQTSWRSNEILSLQEQVGEFKKRMKEAGIQYQRPANSSPVQGISNSEWREQRIREDPTLADDLDFIQESDAELRGRRWDNDNE